MTTQNIDDDDDDDDDDDNEGNAIITPAQATFRPIQD